MRLWSKIAVIPLTLVLFTACQTGQTPERTATQAKIVTVEGFIATVSLYNLAVAQVNANCPMTPPKLPQAVCDGVKTFGDGTNPGDPMCGAITISDIGKANKTCGFRRTLPVIRTTLNQGFAVADSAVTEINLIQQQVNGFITQIGVK